MSAYQRTNFMKFIVPKNEIYNIKKELEKALNFLTPNEQHVLRMWVNEFVSDRQDLQIVISN